MDLLRPLFTYSSLTPIPSLPVSRQPLENRHPNQTSYRLRMPVIPVGYSNRAPGTRIAKEAF